MNIKHYCFRVEFQLRGLPHVHGVAWIEDDEISPYINEDGLLNDNCITLIDKWSSCSIDTGDKVLDELVKTFQIHRHTKSCRKKNCYCRYGFPKFPSDKTLIAKPLDEEDPIKKKKLVERVLNILERVYDALKKFKRDEIPGNQKSFGNLILSL